MKYVQVISRLWNNYREEIEINERMLVKGKIHPVILPDVTKTVEEYKYCFPTLSYLRYRGVPWREEAPSPTKDEKLKALQLMLQRKENLLDNMKNTKRPKRITKDMSEEQKMAIEAHRGGMKLVKKEVDCLYYYLDLVKNNTV